MNDQPVTKKSLDVIGKIIFAFTTVISVILIALGIFVIVKENLDKTPNTQDPTASYTVSLGSTKTINNTVNGQFYQFTLFTSSVSTSDYSVSVDNGSLNKITSANGKTASFNRETSVPSEFDVAYKVSLDGNVTYTFVVKATGSTLKIRISKT